MTQQVTINEKIPVSFWNESDEKCKDFLHENLKIIIQALSKSLIEKYFERNIERVYERVIEKYSKKERTYHNLHHICDMIQQIYTIQNATPQQKALLISATIYHDYVYDFTLMSFNEAFSARQFLWDSMLLEIPEGTANQIYYLILCTWYSKNVEPVDSLGYFLQDCDFAGFGYKPDLYKRLQEKVLKEQEQLSDFNPENYKENRKKWLQLLLDKEFIYHTDHFRELYETQARINIAKELELL